MRCLLRYTLKITGACVFYVSLAHGQIAFDAASNSGAKTTQQSYSWTHTPVGTPSVVFVCTGAQGSNDTNRLVSSITYGAGNNLSLVKRQDEPVTENITVEIWALANPPSGAQTVTVTFVGVMGSRSAAAAVTYTGSDTTTATEASNGAQGSGTPTVDVTSVSDNAWAIDSLYVKGGTPLTPGANQTQRANIDFGSQNFHVSDEGPKTPAGAITMSWSTNTNPFVLAAAVIKPAAGAPAVPRRLPLLGVGMMLSMGGLKMLFDFRDRKRWWK